MGLNKATSHDLYKFYFDYQQNGEEPQVIEGNIPPDSDFPKPWRCYPVPGSGKAHRRLSGDLRPGLASQWKQSPTKEGIKTWSLTHRSRAWE